MTIDPVDLLQRLVRCESVTPAEGGALALLADVLGGAGFACERAVFSEPGTPDVDNLYARIGTGAPFLLFAGHTDVVPPGDAARWSVPPFAAEIVEGDLIGRGAEDMKGGIAAFVAAAIDWVGGAAPARGSIGLLVTGDEEGPAVNGTVKLLGWAKARGEVFDHCILGEPTNVAALGDMMKIGRRGSLSGTLIVRGKQGHVAYPERAKNPIDGIARLVAGLRAEPIDTGTAHFPPTNLEFTSIDVGNPAGNVIPAEARARFNIRFNDRWNADTLAEEIRARCRRLAGNAIEHELVFEPSNADAFLTAPGPFVELVAKAIEAETGSRPALSTTGGTSDARFIKDHCPVIEFGLVGRTMHQIDERVPVAEVRRLAAIYRRVIEAYFA